MKSLKLGIIVLFLGTIGFINTSLAVEETNSTASPESPLYQAIYNCTQYQQLTTTQKASVDKALNDLQSKMKLTLNQLQSKQEALDNALETSPPNETTVNSVAKEISALHNQIFTAHVQAQLEMAKVGLNAKKCWESSIQK